MSLCLKEQLKKQFTEIYQNATHFSGKSKLIMVDLLRKFLILFVNKKLKKILHNFVFLLFCVTNEMVTLFALGNNKNKNKIMTDLQIPFCPCRLENLSPMIGFL